MRVYFNNIVGVVEIVFIAFWLYDMFRKKLLKIYYILLN